MLKQMDYSDVPSDPSLGAKGLTQEYITRRQAENRRMPDGIEKRNDAAEVAQLWEAYVPGDYTR